MQRVPCAFADLPPEQRANPSKQSWGDGGEYLVQQRRRLPSHKFRRLHLNLPGSPEGSAYQAEMVMDAIAPGTKVLAPVRGVEYYAFVDMSGGSNDDACLGIGHADVSGRVILDVAYAGLTFQHDFQNAGISYIVSERTKGQLCEAMEPLLNGHKVVLLDVPVLEEQCLGLVWRGGKIDHPNGEHDDWANASAGAVIMAGQLGQLAGLEPWLVAANAAGEKGVR
jgi:hypothetical protein